MKKVTKQFVSEFYDNDFQMTQSEENSRMWGNVPTYETVVKHWIRKNENEVRWTLTDQGKKIAYNKRRLIKILATAVNDIIERDGEERAYDFFNSGQPIDFGNYFRIIP